MVGGTEKAIWLIGLPFITSACFGPGSVDREMEADLLRVNDPLRPYVKPM